MRRNRRPNKNKCNNLMSLTNKECFYYMLTHHMKRNENKINGLIKDNKEYKRLMGILEKELFSK